MSRVLAEVAGKLLTLLGYDGTDFRNIHVDAAGDLQVDVLSTAFPAGIATEATLALVATEAKLELCRVFLSTIDGDVVNSNAYLLALLTELRLKADLTETQPVSVAALPLPTGAATAAHQVTQTTALQLIDDLRDALDSIGSDALRTMPGLDGATHRMIHVDAQGDTQVDVLTSALPTGAATAAHQVTLQAAFQDQAFTYKDQVVGKYQHTMVGDGSYTVLGGQVPDGEIWVLGGIMGYNWSNAITAMYIGLQKGGVAYWVAGTGGVVAKEAFSTTGQTILVKDDYPAVYFNGCLDGDSLTMMYNGYSMTKAT